MTDLPAETPAVPATSVRLATAALTVTCMAWGVSFVFIKDLDDHVQWSVGGPTWTAPLWIATVRFLIAGLLLLLLPAVRRGLARPVWRDGFLLAVPSILGYVLQAAGMRGVDAGTNAFLTSLYTPLTPLIAWLLLRKAPDRRILVAVGVAMAGVLLLSIGEREHEQLEPLVRDKADLAPAREHFAWYASLVALGAVCWALQILGIDRWARRHPSGSFTCALFLWIAVGGATCMGLGLAVSDPASLGRGRLAQALDPSPAGAPEDAVAAAWPTAGQPRTEFVARALRAVAEPGAARPLAGLVLLSTLLAMSLMNRFQPVLDPSRAALLYTLEPAFAGTFAYVMHGEAFGGKKLAGCAVLLLANLIVEAPAVLALLRSRRGPAPATAA